MGSFSWIRADKTTKRKNLTYGDVYKILVPKEFGGGYIKDVYEDYGYVFSPEFNNKNRYYVNAYGDKLEVKSEWINNDLYGILAYWNGCEELKFIGDKKPEHMIDILSYGQTNLQTNRCMGIDIGCYDYQVNKLKYPLKLVSASYNGTYEDCKMRSYSDPDQGFYKTYWR